MAKCSAINQAGKACGGVPINGSQWCFHHHPDNAQGLKRSGSKGGKRGGRGRPVSELASLRAENASIRAMLKAEEIEPKTASVLVQSINTDARLIAVSLDAKEQEELLGRLEELEAAVQQRNDDLRTTGGF